MDGGVVVVGCGFSFFCQQQGRRRRKRGRLRRRRPCQLSLLGGNGGMPIQQGIHARPLQEILQPVQVSHSYNNKSTKIKNYNYNYNYNYNCKNNSGRNMSEQNIPFAFGAACWDGM
jgi:hypothetical protein